MLAQSSTAQRRLSSSNSATATTRRRSTSSSEWRRPVCRFHSFGRAYLDARTDQGHAQDVKNQSKDHAQGNVRSDPGYQKAELELRTLIERFANNTSLQGVINALDQIYKDARDDRELSKWFTDLNKYIRRVLQEPGFVMKDQCDQEGRRLRDNSQGLFSERYRVPFALMPFPDRSISSSHSLTVKSSSARLSASSRPCASFPRSLQRGRRL